MLGKIIPGNVLQDIWKYSHEELTGKNKMRFNIRQICVCVVSVVGKISDYQPEGPGFKSPAWSRVEVWTTFFHHTVRGQGR